MNIAILGATGLFGKALVKSLSEDTDYHLTLIARHARSEYQDFTKSSQKISTHLLIMEVDFCPVLCIPEVPVLQDFRGISHFVWYCKAVSDLS